MSDKIVEVILDGALEEQEIVDAATGPAVVATQGLKVLLRKKGKRTPEDRAFFGDLFAHVVMAHVAPYAEDALRSAHKHLMREAKAVQEAGPDGVRAVPALDNAALMARAAARKGLTDGET